MVCARGVGAASLLPKNTGYSLWTWARGFAQGGASTDESTRSAGGTAHAARPKRRHAATNPRMIPSVARRPYRWKSGARSGPARSVAPRWDGRGSCGPDRPEAPGGVQVQAAARRGVVGGNAITVSAAWAPTRRRRGAPPGAPRPPMGAGTSVSRTRAMPGGAAVRPRPAPRRSRREAARRTATGALARRGARRGPRRRPGQ